MSPLSIATQGLLSARQKTLSIALHGLVVVVASGVIDGGTGAPNYNGRIATQAVINTVFSDDDDILLILGAAWGDVWRN